MPSFKDLSSDVAHRWGAGKTLGIFFLALSVSWLPGLWAMHSGLSSFFDAAERDYLPAMPKITINGGKVSAEPPGPHTLKDPQTGRAIVIIDPSKPASEFTNLEGDMLVLAQSHLIIHRERRRETKLHDLSQVDGVAFGREEASKWLGLARRLATPILTPLILTFSLSWKLTLAVLYAAVALMFGTGLRYASLLRLSMLAVAGMLLLDGALDAAKLRIPMWGFIGLCAQLAAVWAAAKAAGAGAGETPAPALH